MTKDDFEPHTRYTVTLRDPTGRLRPANLYVYRLHDRFMVARLTESSGVLRKIAYDDVAKIVGSGPVPKNEQFHVPEALLTEQTWHNRDSMEHYASSARLGK